MLIEINGKQYLNPDFRVANGIAEMRIQSDKTFAEIAEDFVVEAGDSIKQYNELEQQIGEYYVEGMASIQLPGEDGTELVTIKYHVSQIGKDAQDAMSGDIEDASDAALELCEIIGEMDQNLNDTCRRIENSQQEQGQQLNNFSQTQTQHTKAIERWESMYNALADRVARLENKVGV